jgi:hypothetical protein
MQAQQAQKMVFLNKGLLYVKDSLFIQGDFVAEDKSEVFQTGKTALTGDFHNNVSQGNVFTADASRNSGAFEFRGKAPQHISGNAPKERYINFPATLAVNMSDPSLTVTMDPNISATAQKVDIIKGRLVLDSRALGDTATMNAHLLVADQVTGNAGGVQVNLALGEHYKNKRLVGFTPPFEKLYADYFFYNFLSRPTAKGLFGNNDRLITNPRTLLNPGLGYIVGMGIIPAGDSYYTSELDPRWPDADFSKRATTGFFFSRAVAEHSFSKYLDDQNAPGYVSGERLVTHDVTNIPLEKGFNYLGNPYMTPLDLTDIVNGTTSTDWGVANGTLKPGFYVLSQGNGSYDGSRFSFSASYLIKQQQGSTYDSGNVAPMQMFIVGSDTPATMKIPRNKRRHDASSNLLRSAEATYEPVDELLIETRDAGTGGYDRLCIVFRNDASLNSGDPFDAVKIFNRSGGVNQIYTRSSDNKDMTVSVISPSTDSLPMYFTPSAEPQQVVLRAGRTGSIASVAFVVLEDTKTGVMTDLRRTPSYTFSSSPSDPSDRFVLHFASNPSSSAAVSLPAAPSANYEGGTLRVYGLNQTGSDVIIYDIQGRMLHRQPLPPSAGPLVVNKRFVKGVYVIKNNATTLRFAVRE